MVLLNVVIYKEKGSMKVWLLPNCLENKVLYNKKPSRHFEGSPNMLLDMNKNILPDSLKTSMAVLQT